ncbi:MAG: UDP-N-acetylmuramoyl-L-alanine--D-glutamate ligase [Bacteroidetes bacterium]|nr:MAG: UDP-N-acetylmuramoyl-L-alanine--D-glutamate ligase [Bacteroidota bacterium]
MKKLVILGAGESGTGAALLAKKNEYEVFVSDSGEIKEKYKTVLWNNKIEFEEKAHSADRILKADQVVKSPGIPDNSELIQQLIKKEIPVISEIEFAGRYTDAFMIGVTGSNGKTTTVNLIYHILKNAGMNVGLTGNVGNSLARQIAEDDKEIYVIELSSYQLDGMEKIKMDIGVLLNITPDHLDRYDNKMENYVDSKFKILELVKPGGHFIYNIDDEVMKSKLRNKQTKGVNLIPFSIEDELDEGAFINENQLIVKINQNQNQFNMLLQELALQGKHNIYNSMAAGIATRVLEVRKEIIRDSLMDFQNIEHRLEYVVKVHGIEYINDSKATNVNSTWYALESMTKPVIWIVGGVDKGNDYSILSELVRKKVKAIICIGAEKKSNRKIHRAFDEIVETIIDASSMEEAVKLSYRLGTKGDVAMLSPCCASFDAFKNYEERGWRFKKAVREL